MRIGQNPAKSIETVPQPARVTVAIITYIPFLSGYYAQSLDVLKLCLQSLTEDTQIPFDLLVFDNASCLEVRNYLLDCQASGQIQYLVLSDKNVGKGGGWNFIFQAAPGEYIAYADSDVVFAPGWLVNSMKLVETFPRVGMVTARPMRTPEKYFTATLDWARTTPGVTLEQGQFQAWEIFKEHNDSLGVEEALARQWYAESIDWRIHYQGCSAYVGAAHFQFLAPKAALQQVFPIPMSRPMGQVRTLDEKLNSEGYLRLSTCEPFVRHLGNSLPGKANQATPTRSVSSSVSRRVLQFAPIRRTLLWLYDRIFRIYYG